MPSAVHDKTLIVAWAIYCNNRGMDPRREDFFQDLEPREQILLVQQACFATLRKYYCPGCWEKDAKRVDKDGGIEMHCGSCGAKYAVDTENKIAVRA